MMMRFYPVLLQAILLLTGSQLLVSSAGDKGSCSSANSFQCPHLTELCNETVYVSDCLDCDGFLSTDTKSDVCFDRRLLNGKDNPNPSYLWRDILGMVVWFFAAGVATSCGVGGGGIYVPLGILLLNFAPKPSSGLSQASIFGASLGGLLLNLRNKHPFTTKLTIHSDTSNALSIKTSDEAPQDEGDVKYYTRPLIDFDMALFLSPMEMAGAVLGVLIQKILPNWLYLSLAAIILGFTAHKTYKKFSDLRGKELAAKAEEATPNDSQVKEEVEQTAEISAEQGGAEQAPPQTDIVESASHEDATIGEATMGDDTEPHLSSDSSNNSNMTEAEKLARRQYWLQRDSRMLPADKISGLIILWLGLILLTFFKGGKGVDSLVGIDCSSPWYGVLIGIQFLWTLGIAAFFGFKLTKQTEDKMRCNYPWHPQDVLWDYQKVRFYAGVTFLAGIVAGLIGIGGGMVLGPMMLVMGIHPRVSSATTATMVVLTSSSVAVLFVTAGLVPWEYAVTFFCICFVGAILGKTKIDAYVKKTGKASLLVFLLATIILLATLGCVVIVFTRLAAADWCFEGFQEFCSINEDSDEDDLCPINRFLFGESHSSGLGFL